jgi:hypothetical protein
MGPHAFGRGRSRSPVGFATLQMMHGLFVQLDQGLFFQREFQGFNAFFHNSLPGNE